MDLQVLAIAILVLVKLKGTKKKIHQSHGKTMKIHSRSEINNLKKNCKQVKPNDFILGICVDNTVKYSHNHH